MLVRDRVLYNQKGGKLRPRWHAPRIVEKIAANGNTALVRQVHNAPDNTKKYHFDDVKVYIQRHSDDPTMRGVSYERSTMASPFISTNSIGQRAFHLSIWAIGSRLENRRGGSEVRTEAVLEALG